MMRKNSKLRLGFLITLAVVLICSGQAASRYLEEYPPGITTQAGQEQEEPARFQAYLDELFRQQVTGNTINLHYTLRDPKAYGIQEYPITLGEISRESSDKAMAELENIQACLEKFEFKELELDQQLTCEILMGQVQEDLEASGFYYYQEPLRPSTGVQAELPILLAEYRFYQQQDVEDYLGLLEQLPEYMDQILEFQQEKAAQGLFMADFALEDILKQCENFISDPQENYLLDTFEDRIQGLEGISQEQQQEYREQNQRKVEECVIPAYQKLIEDLEKLRGKGENTQGLCYLPQGKAYYEYLVSSYTGSQRSVDELKEETAHQRAADLTQAAKLISENPELIAQCTSYAFAQQSPEEILLELQQKLQGDFPAPPGTEFTVKYVHPSLEEHMAPAFYLTVPLDDISENAIYINGANGLQKLRLYTTLAHEGYPGHLYQNLMERSQGLHPIRSLLGTSGYSEGWATYVEMWAYRYAELDPQLSSILQLDQAALLSLYATADMGIHYDGWSLEEMKGFFGEYQITDQEALTEIYQLILEEPAHYLKYYIGYLEFLRLQEFAKDQYGTAYSDYEFHAAVLSMGPAQFQLLEKYLPEYYKRQ